MPPALVFRRTFLLLSAVRLITASFSFTLNSAFSAVLSQSRSEQEPHYIRITDDDDAARVPLAPRSTSRSSSSSPAGATSSSPDHEAGGSSSDVEDGRRSARTPFVVQDEHDPLLTPDGTTTRTTSTDARSSASAQEQSRSPFLLFRPLGSSFWPFFSRAVVDVNDNCSRGGPTAEEIRTTLPDCSICQEVINPGEEFRCSSCAIVDPGTQRITSTGGVIHFLCAVHYVRSLNTNSPTFPCPTCRKPVLKPIGADEDELVRAVGLATVASSTARTSSSTGGPQMGRGFLAASAPPQQMAIRAAFFSQMQNSHANFSQTLGRGKKKHITGTHGVVWEVGREWRVG